MHVPSVREGSLNCVFANRKSNTASLAQLMKIAIGCAVFVIIFVDRLRLSSFSVRFVMQTHKDQNQLYTITQQELVVRFASITQSLKKTSNIFFFFISGWSHIPADKFAGIVHAFAGCRETIDRRFSGFPLVLSIFSLEATSFVMGPLFSFLLIRKRIISVNAVRLSITYII